MVGAIAAGIGKPVEQRGLPGIGVTDNSDRGYALSAPAISTQASLQTNLRESGLKMPNPHVQKSPIRLQLSLARPSQTNPAPLPLKVGPPPDQSRREMPQLSQFDLKLAFMGLRPKGENVQNQSGPVYNATMSDLLQVTFLDRRDRLINDDEMCTLH